MLNRKEQTRRYLSGMCLAYNHVRGKVSAKELAENIEWFGTRSVRLWMHAPKMFDSINVPKKEICDDYHDLISELYAHGVTQIVGMSHFWFYPEKLHVKYGMKAYRRADPDYPEFLDAFEETWRSLAAEFPEITVWETGNEPNHTPFMTCIDGTEIPWEERIDIATDMMFRSCRAVRGVNPAADIVMPGLAPISGNNIGVVGNFIAVNYSGMVDSVKRIYANIASGAFGSTDPRDFFDALGWHPYYAAKRENGEWYFAMPDDEWVELNRQIYQAAVDAGDEGVPCVLSEYGANDWGDTGGLVEITRKGFELIREKMPFASVVHAYRLTDILDDDDRDCYSFCRFENGHLVRKPRADALREQYEINNETLE